MPDRDVRLDGPFCPVCHAPILDDGSMDFDPSRLARSTPVPASNVSEGLREALAEDAALLHHYVHPDVSFEECDGARCVRRRQQIALAHAAPEGLDVERLARVLHEATVGCVAGIWADCNHKPQAERILARLSQPDATEEAGR